MDLTFTVECDFCEHAFGMEGTLDEQIAGIAEWMKNHSCTPQPTRDDVISWSGN